MRNLSRLRSGKAQSTAEYAVIIALVIGAAVAMQTYVKRSLQGRIYDASNKFYTDVTGSEDWAEVNPGVTPTILTNKQFEPTELARQSTEKTTKDVETSLLETGGKVTRESERTTQQGEGDYQKYEYNEE